MDVRVRVEPLVPGVEYGEYADPDSGRCGGFEQSLGDGGEERVERIGASACSVRVSSEEGPEANREREDDVEVGAMPTSA